MRPTPRFAVKAKECSHSNPPENSLGCCGPIDLGIRPAGYLYPLAKRCSLDEYLEHSFTCSARQSDHRLHVSSHVCCLCLGRRSLFARLRQSPQVFDSNSYPSPSPDNHWLHLRPSRCQTLFAPQAHLILRRDSLPCRWNLDLDPRYPLTPKACKAIHGPKIICSLRNSSYRTPLIPPHTSIWGWAKGKFVTSRQGH